MANIDKVLEGLEYCTSWKGCTANCPYWGRERGGDCPLDADALELLRTYRDMFGDMPGEIECVTDGLAEPEPEKPYRGIIVALDTDGDVLAAWRVDSYEQAARIMYEEFMRLADDFEGDVTVRNRKDGFGEAVTEATYNGGQDKVTYKLVMERAC